MRRSGVSSQRPGYQEKLMVALLKQEFLTSEKRAKGGFMLTKLSRIGGAVILLLILSFQATAGDYDNGVVSVVADELDISSSKARGGVGAIFAYAENYLDDDDFERVVDGIPDIDRIIDAAPYADDDSFFGLRDTLSELDSPVAGRSSLIDTFDELDMDRDMIDEFLSIVYDYVEDVSGERAKEILEDLFLDF
jgi:hypothetical protein